MRRERTLNNPEAMSLGIDWTFNDTIGKLQNGRSRQLFIGLVLVIALIAFEIFNFDTTQYALLNLLGDVSFAGLRWATILAVAFCFIDFAGLAHLFSPDRARDKARESWYLMGAWLLGASMNALMTWWAVSLTLLSHEFGNEVLSRQQLLQIVPIFVATLVWLTRILFIGAFSVAGDHLFSPAVDYAARSNRPSVRQPGQVTNRTASQPTLAKPAMRRVPRQPDMVNEIEQPGVQGDENRGSGPPPHQRVRQQPPQPRPRQPAYASPKMRDSRR